MGFELTHLLCAQLCVQSGGLELFAMAKQYTRTHTHTHAYTHTHAHTHTHTYTHKCGRWGGLALTALEAEARTTCLLRFCPAHFSTILSWFMDTGSFIGVTSVLTYLIRSIAVCPFSPTLCPFLPRCVPTSHAVSLSSHAVSLPPTLCPYLPRCVPTSHAVSLSSHAVSLTSHAVSLFSHAQVVQAHGTCSGRRAPVYRHPSRSSLLPVANPAAAGPRTVDASAAAAQSLTPSGLHRCVRMCVCVSGVCASVCVCLYVCV